MESAIKLVFLLTIARHGCHSIDDVAARARNGKTLERLAAHGLSEVSRSIRIGQSRGSALGFVGIQRRAYRDGP